MKQCNILICTSPNRCQQTASKTMKTADLSLEQLDYWVAKARNITLIPDPNGKGFMYHPHDALAPRRWAPTRYWSQGGPIIEQAHIDLNWDWEQCGEWTASMEPDINAQGATVLQAAMRAYVIAVFGEEIDT